MKTIPAAIAVLLCFFLSASAQDPASVVSIRTIAPDQPLKAGKPATITIELSIASPYHINSDRPLEDYLIPTTLEFAPYPGLTFGKTAFPPAAMKKFSFSDSPMSVYEGVIRVSVEIVADSSLKQKDIVLQGKVRYQACDDSTCLRPVRKPFSLKISVADTSQPVVASRETPPQPAAAPKQAAKTAPAASADFGDKGILVTLVLVFLGGLALNLTPCVYPMIPITISYFGGQAQGKKGSTD